MSLRIIAKRWNNPTDQIITHVEIEGQKIFEMITVWKFIDDKKGKCHTLEEGFETNVRALEKPNGTKYLTTSPDGIIKNNLDNLPPC